MIDDDKQDKNEVEHNAGQTSDLTSKNEIKKKRDKRPEMARYQPPNSRNASHSLNTSNKPANSSAGLPKNFESKSSTNQVEKPKNKEDEKIVPNKQNNNSIHEEPKQLKEKSNIKQIEKQKTPIKEIESQKYNITRTEDKMNKPETFNTTTPESTKQVINNRELNKTPGAGLIKLNQNALNELISKNEKLNLNDNPKKELNGHKNEDTEENKHLIVNSTHSNRFQKNDPGSMAPNEFLNENMKYRTLFDPNNPEKPIYVGLQTRANLNVNISQNSINKTRTNLDEKRESGKTSPRDNNQSENKVDESILKVNNISKKIQQLELKLKQLIDSFDSSKSLDQFLTNINSFRKQIEKLCIDSLFLHLETSTNLNIDLTHWRSCYHQLIETLRKEHNSKMLNQNQRDQLSKCLGEYIDEGVLFYKNLIENLENKFLKFKSMHFIDLNFYDKTIQIINSINSAQKSPQLVTVIKTKDMKYALMCINRLLICLGDLERYREMIFPSQLNYRDYSMARSYYLKAMCLAPKSSRAYHQLAILAIYTKRRLDACYYYFRCLEVSSPLTSVRQALNLIFEEVRVKTDSINKMIKNAILNKEKSKKKEVVNIKNRVEIWYKPAIGSNPNQTKNLIESETSDDNDDDSSESEDENDDRDTNDEGSFVNEKKLSLNELNKRFMLNYLNTIGKLFTKVGMETYDEVCSNMLKEFSELLRRSPCPLGKMRLLQINTINISIIDLIYKSSNQNNTEGTIVRSQLLEFSIQLSIDMFSLIVKRFNSLMKKCKLLTNQETEINSEYEWNQFFPSIKVFIDWMLCNIKLWNPLPDQLSPDLGPNPNRWETLINLFNLINTHIKTFENSELRNDLYRVKLEEDLELAGFVPLSLSLSREDYDYQNFVNLNLDYLKQLSEFIVEKNKIKKRMQKVLLFADYLCGLEEPLVKYDVLNNCYSQITQSTSRITKKPLEKINNRTISTCSSSSVKSFENSNVDDLDANIDFFDEESSDELNELKEKHRLLKAKMAEQQQQEKKIRSLVEANSQRQIELEIRPKFIVADTNCFIDHLNLIDKILNTNYYILIVPLLVLNELEKLAKSTSHLNDDSLEHVEYLQKNAKKSIEYLNNKFDKRDRNIKAMTSQGSVLETIQFRTEEIIKPGTNDELILGCCLYYCRDNARDFMPNNKNDAIHLYRDVVLLTEDRHLRLKAHTRNVPVKEIKHFCKWSGLFTVMSEKKKPGDNNYGKEKQSIVNQKK